MSSHSTVGASVIQRRKICAGSRRMEAKVPNKSNEFSQEGTLGHAVGEVCLNNDWPAAQLVGLPFAYDDHGEKKVADVTSDMAEHVQVYIDAVRDRAVEGCVLLVEKRFHLKQIHEDLFGTSDAVVWNPNTKTLHCLDLKYGAGLPVEVKGNMQLRYYAIGALLETGYPAVKVEMAIVQPRCPHADGPVRSETIDTIDLIDFADDLLQIVKATEEPDAPLVPSEECRFCNAAGICPAVAAKAQEVAKAEFRADLSYDPAVLAETLRWLPILETWCNSVREYAYGEAEHGRCPPGWKLVWKTANRKFKPGVAPELAAALGVAEHELFNAPTMKGVTDIEKLAPGKNSKLRAQALEPFVTKESSGLALAPEADRREAVKLDAKAEFSNA
jgi:hypothetical protein